MRETDFMAWSGDRTKGYKMHGYWYRKADNHPLSTKRGYVLEHRLVMENHLNQYLPKGAVIHHINGLRDDNRIENLEYIPEQSRHAKSHDTGARNSNGHFVTNEPIFNEIKFRLYNKNTKQNQIYSLSKLISTTFRSSQFEFRGRYTGLKDKNGKEIYEGDIVRFRVDFPDQPFDDGVVRWADGGYWTSQIPEDMEELLSEELNDLEGEVIGNIYENPELVKK